MPKKKTKEQNAACAKRWRARNKDKLKEARDDDHKKDPANYERVKQYNMEWARKNPEKHAICQYKASAKKRGYEFALTKEGFSIIFFGSCVYCGRTPARGVDRFDNTIGYTPENCEPCCRWCNTAKSDHTFEHFVAMCHRVVVNHHEALIGRS